MQRNQESIEHSSLSARQVGSFTKFKAKDYRHLQKFGIGLDESMIHQMMSARHGMDSIQPTITTGSITTPVQFLQNWLPGMVKIITAARKIDDLTGISVIGSWEDEQVVQAVMELTGTSVPYGDYTNVPFSSWNVNFNYRTVVQFEEGMRVGEKEAARAARIRVDSATAKRESAALALEIIRNTIGFFGYNAGNNNTYGFLNDPALPNYTTVAVGASTQTFWSTKTYLEILNDIRTMIQTLRNQSQDQIDPEKVNITLGLATAVVEYLSVTSDFGNSVRDWLTATYPRIRVVSAPQLNAASGGLNVGYMYAEKIDDLSTDDNKTFIQPVPTKFMLLGVSKLTKSYEESYTNATAGIMCKRPWAVVRVNGL
jgi:hypothetical protein